MSELKKWRVETRVISKSIYYVDAEDEKSAEAASCEASPDHTEDEQEETMSIVEIDDLDARPRPPQESITPHD